MAVAAAAAAADDDDDIQFFHYLTIAVDGSVNGLYVLLAPIEAIHDCIALADVLAMVQTTLIFEKLLYMFYNYSFVVPTDDRRLHKYCSVETNAVNSIVWI